MIIEIDKDATVFDRKADAALIVVDPSGREPSGLFRGLPDIAQVIEMRATRKELTSGDILHFELEEAHLYVITNSDIETSLVKVLDLAESHEVSSINLPDIEEVSTVVWGIDHPSNILLRLCRV